MESERDFVNGQQQKQKFFMNDVMPVISLGCTCFLKIAAGISLLWISRAILAFTARSKPIVQTTITTSTGASQAIATPMAEPLVVAPQEQEEVIECGACHQVIKTPPIAQAENVETYHCEHCGARCQVPL